MVHHKLHSSLASLYDLRDFFCYVAVSSEPKFLLSIGAADTNLNLIHLNVLPSLLAKALYLVLFDLKSLNEDDNLQVAGMCRLDARK